MIAKNLAHQAVHGGATARFLTASELLNSLAEFDSSTSLPRGPAIIGRDTRIVNSYIGPFTSIYHDVVVEGSEIEHSIVLEHSHIEGIQGRIADSLIGRNARLTRSPIKPAAHKLTLGDYSDVGLL